MKAKKYEWHDLRLNPDDLPKKSTDVVIICYEDIQLRNGCEDIMDLLKESFFIDYAFAIYDQENKNWYRPDTLDDYEGIKVIAWRNLEEFCP